MARVKTGPQTKARRKKWLRAAKGYWGGKHRLFKTAKEAVMRAYAYAYRDRRNKKREMRRLWNMQLNAYLRQRGISYSKFIYGLKLLNVSLSRKILVEMARTDEEGFNQLVEKTKKALSSVSK